MKKQVLFAAVATLLASAPSFAQIKMQKDNFTPISISNDGTVCGTYGQATPYFLWSSQDGKMTEIGSTSNGPGSSGNGIISADGNYVSGIVRTTLQPITELQRKSYTEKYTFTDIVNINGGYIAVGKTEDDKGIVIRNTGFNTRWNSIYMDSPINTICFLDDYVGIIAGDNGFYQTTTGSGSWWSDEYEHPGKDDEIDKYVAIDFSGELYGAVAAILADGSGALYYSENGAETWSAATGWEGHPTAICHASDKKFYMVTEEGRIYTSEGAGEWTQCGDLGKALKAVSFADTEKGIVVGDNFIAITTNGGTTWTEVESKINGIWLSAVWNGNEIYVAGKGEAIIYSADNGKTWNQINVDMADQEGNINSIIYNGNELYTCGTSSTFYFRQSDSAETQILEMARYNRNTHEWIPLGYFSPMGVNGSGGYCVSGDGKSVGGNAYVIRNADSFKFKNVAAAAVWNEENDKLIELPGLYQEKIRNARVDVLNADGTIAAGYQDIDGMWVASVWKKENGVWGDGVILFKDNEVGFTDYKNVMRECSCVSPNGKWIGGYGSDASFYETDEEKKMAEPYIWSEETGVIQLGMLENAPSTNGYYGLVKGISDDGSLAFGTFQTTMPGIDIWGVPFIWTKEDGMRDLNEWIAEKYSSDLEGFRIYTIEDLSDNGQYLLCSIRKDREFGSCVIDLNAEGTGISLGETAADNSVRIYPNPVSDMIHIDLNSAENVKISLYGLTGNVVKTAAESGTTATMNVTDVPEGMYILVVDNGKNKTVRKMHITH
ncbi:MAG: T9SS type A sorting domain-containing protein [Prevotella sp.]|uniref:T9SS type A sorting domain-containing protein n=1 Tax=Prevotella sp. TaxID=59823 RepID=UPI002580C0EC|nr:T9SS type A sorting domain-containing protein [Prevotella sp.]MBS5874980.1 T9SS type A sorting domain-containing protein [Prevotella sp.]